MCVADVEEVMVKRECGGEEPPNSSEEEEEDKYEPDLDLEADFSQGTLTFSSSHHCLKGVVWFNVT